MRLSHILFLFFISINLLFSQELYVCESYTEDGSPVGPINNLEIKPYGTAIYILMDNEKEFQDPVLYLFVDKFVDGKFTPFDSKTLSIKKEDTWAVTSFEFKEQGIYEVYFLNSSEQRLASHKIEVVFSQEYLSQNTTVARTYMGNSKFVFCELVINGKPTNIFNTISLSRTNGQAYIYLNNYAPFGIDIIKVQVWKRSKTDSNYEELVDSKKYKILPEWSDTFFKYNYTNTGDYKIDVFDNKDNFISSNIITVTN